MGFSVVSRKDVDENTYLVERRLYFSAARYPHKNKERAATRDSRSAVGCRHGTGKMSTFSLRINTMANRYLQ